MTNRILTALPVFNEAQHIHPVLDQVANYADEILVIDDGSSDDTPHVLAEREGLHVVTHAQNQGYGAALVSAFRFAQESGFDGLVTIDCDGQHEPKLIPAMGQRLFSADEEAVDIVSGSRYLQSFSGDSLPPEDRREINWQITAQLNREFDLNLTDAFCGFKAYRVSALQTLDITELGYAMPLQLWVQVARAGLRIVEFPVPLVYLDEERSFGGALDDARQRMSYYQEVLKRELAAPAPISIDAQHEDHATVKPSPCSA